MRFTTEHRTINTFHFSAALNVMMILLVFIVIIFTFYGKSGIRVIVKNRPSPDQISSSKNAVVINERNEFFMGKEEVTSDKLLDKFTVMKVSNLNTLIVYPSKSTKFNAIVNVISTARKVGIKNITVQTDLASF